MPWWHAGEVAGSERLDDQHDQQDHDHSTDEPKQEAEGVVLGTEWVRRVLHGARDACLGTRGARLA